MTTTLTTHETTPRAWVGCLGCYNDGRLTGRWLDADQAQDLTDAGLATENGTCTTCGADEFHVFDHEGLHGKPGEMGVATFVELAEVADIINENGLGDAFAAFLDDEHRTGTAEDEGEFSSRFVGEWSSVEHYVEELMEGCGVIDDVPSSLRYYFDWAGLARDMQLNGEITVIDHPFGVWVFRTF